MGENKDGARMFASRNEEQDQLPVVEEAKVTEAADAPAAKPKRAKAAAKRK
jgi:hypothetical protein